MSDCDEIPTPSECPSIMGEDGLADRPAAHEDAWFGFMRTHRQLARALDGELETEHGLSLSGLELLGRLAAAEGQRLRLSALAEQASLSPSRVSRLVDTLEARGLIERQPCAEDGRATNACLTEAGLAAMEAARETHLAGVDRRFFDRLSESEIEQLAVIFERLAAGAADDRVPVEARASGG
jgi:DNA-binding MarR family transcriptional regulator